MTLLKHFLQILGVQKHESEFQENGSKTSKALQRFIVALQY